MGICKFINKIINRYKEKAERNKILDERLRNAANLYASAPDLNVKNKKQKIWEKRDR